VPKRQPAVNKVKVIPTKTVLRMAKGAEGKSGAAPTFGGAFGAKKGN
jgi:hypothetical protein